MQPGTAASGASGNEAPGNGTSGNGTPGNRAPGITLTRCRVREILERVGDKWSLFVISCLGDGPKRFTALKRSVDGISQRMLTVTLRGLERDGIVSRTMYPVMPPRVDYELTPLGRTLLDAVGALMTWADAHLDEVDAARAAYDARTPDWPGGWEPRARRGAT